VKTGNRPKATASSTKTKVSGVVLCALLLAHNFPAEAQQPEKIPRIGYLTVSALSALSKNIGAFRQGLREHRYVEGKNIFIEWRAAEGKRDRLPALATELLHLKVAVIVTGGPGATRPVKEATSIIPIVMAQDPDPVSNGFVTSLARPGGNITGLSTLASEISGKRLELLKDVVPQISRVAVFGTSVNPDNTRELREIENTAAAFGVKVQYLDILSPREIETAFQAAAKARAEAVLWLVSGQIGQANRKEIAELAAKHRLPVMYTQRIYVEAHGLMSYGVSFSDLYHRAATYVDKILKGAKPADLPVEQPTKFDLVINLKTAKALALKIRAHLLMEADGVIE
jgi:ABC-type uncharacterized transport system substrate-binding protein